jgi:hypothetical protein
MDPCTVYLHVPKTGGQTLISSLRLSYGRDATIQLSALDKPLKQTIGAISQERLATARLVIGHLPYGVHAYLPNVCEYVTLLRDPVARVHSLYKFVLRAVDHPLYEQVRDEKLSLRDFVGSDIDATQTRNGQTRQLAGDPNEPPDRGSLEAAKRNLSTFAAIGLTEKFNESFVHFRRTLRLRIPAYATRNVSPTVKAEPERDVDELIRDANQLDIELYDFACELFEQQLQRHDSRSFRREANAVAGLARISKLVPTQFVSAFAGLALKRGRPNQ